MITHKRLTLANGTRVILVPSKDTAAVSLLVFFEVGSRYESAKISGASHFIEHMMFRGTERRPTQLDISRDLDSVGADYNAGTDKDNTCYYVKLQAEKLALAADLLEDIIYHSAVRQADMDGERSVITEELRMYEDDPRSHVEELMEARLFEDSPLGRRISGSAQTVAGIGRQDLLAYRDAYYVPSRTVVAVAGKFEEAEALRLIEEKFGGKPARKAPRSFRRFAPVSGARSPRVTVQTRETEQVQLAIGLPSYSFDHERLAALSVLSTVLGGSMSSRLFLEVRAKRGLAYSVASGHRPYQDTGLFVVQAGLTKTRLAEAIRVIVRELSRLKTEDVSGKDLSRAQEYIKGRMVLGLEESSSLADFFARQELLQGRIETPEEKIAKIFAVTAADVRRTANELFRASRLTMALIGPFKDGAPFAKLISGL